MSEEFIVGDGDQAKLVPVELKDHSKDPVITDLVKEMEKLTGVPPEMLAPVVEKKKRGRPKKVAAVREYYCSTCREKYDDLTVMKMGCGESRFAIFCPNCQKALGFNDAAANEKMAKLLKNPNKR
jgi:hypothetical protein